MRRLLPLGGTLLLLCLAATTTATDAAAQGGLFGRAKRRAEDAAKRKADEKTDRAVDAAINSVTCVVGDAECIAQAEADGKSVTVTDEEGKPLPAKRQPARIDAEDATEEAAAAKPAVVGAGAWANYDFQPGETPLLVEDLRNDPVGDFPRRLEASEGNGEIVEWNGRRWLRLNGSNNNVVLLPARRALPERFTLEFTMASQAGECWVYPSGTQAGTHLHFGAEHDGGLRRADGRELGVRAANSSKLGTAFTARVMIDGKYVKSYADEKRLVNAPNVEFDRGDAILLYCSGTDDKPMHITDIRLAAGGRKLYDVLAEKGRVATQGIYFDTGADRIRPESTPTLKEIAALLSEHPELRLTIEGHTDDVGAAPANLALSQRRADAVKAALVTTFGVAADRLETKGIGAARPAAANATPEGRQQNRRVELVKR